MMSLEEPINSKIQLSSYTHLGVGALNQFLRTTIGDFAHYLMTIMFGEQLWLYRIG